MESHEKPSLKETTGHWTTASTIIGIMAITATVIAYIPATNAGFYFDDLPNIVEVPALHWDRVSFEAVKDVATDSLLPRRFLSNLSFAVDHLRGGLDPRPFHWTNIILHLLTGVALSLLASAYAAYGFDGATPGRGPRLASAMAATSLFLLHPLNTQAVTYVVQRMTSMAALFTILSLWLYVLARRPGSRSRRMALFMASGISWIAALLSKENALVLPAVVVAFELCFHRRVWLERARAVITDPKRRSRFGLAALSGILALGTITTVYLGGNPISLTETMSGRNFSGIERVLTQSRVQFFYLGLLFWPMLSALSLDHGFVVSRSLLDPPSTLFAILAWVVLFLVVVALARRTPRYGFPLLAYVIFHLVEAGPINLELVFEHRMYLPMSMLVLSVTAGLLDLSEGRRRVALGLVLVAAAVLAFGTYQRNLVWADALTFHRDTAAKAPDKFRPWYNLGTELGKAGHLEEAQKALIRAVELRPDHSECHNQLGNIALISDDLPRAMSLYRDAVRLDPRNLEASYNLALAYERSGNIAQAVRAYESFIVGARLRPDLSHLVPRVELHVGRLRMMIRR